MSLKVLNNDVIASLLELQVTFLTSEAILGSIQSHAVSDEEKFINLYDGALSAGIINVWDNEMTCKLKEITVDFKEKNIIKILHVSCEHAETYETLGLFLCDFCYGLEKEKASSYILHGNN